MKVFGVIVIVLSVAAFVFGLMLFDSSMPRKVRIDRKPIYGGTMESLGGTMKIPKVVDYVDIPNPVDVQMNEFNKGFRIPALSFLIGSVVGLVFGIALYRRSKLQAEHDIRDAILQPDMRDAVDAFSELIGSLPIVKPDIGKKNKNEIPQNQKQVQEPRLLTEDDIRDAILQPDMRDAVDAFSKLLRSLPIVKPDIIKIDRCAFVGREDFLVPKLATSIEDLIVQLGLLRPEMNPSDVQKRLSSAKLVERPPLTGIRVAIFKQHSSDYWETVKIIVFRGEGDSNWWVVTGGYAGQDTSALAQYW